jgi:FAD/FMN-containing dehydrogenase
MLSARIIGADGKAQTVSATENQDLWWAIRGAGHNFGIITSLTVKAYPEINGGMHYMGLVAFPDTLLETVVKTFSDLKVDPTMAISLLFIRAPPAFDPCVVLALWHAGSEESAKKEFKTVFDLGGMVIHEGMVPYDHTNDGLDYLCQRGKPLELLRCPHCWKVAKLI